MDWRHSTIVDQQLTNDTRQPNKSKRHQTRSNATLIVIFYRFFRGGGSLIMIRDRDCIYGTIVTSRILAMGIRDKPIAPASPWQNGFAERLIGSIRRECLDHFIVLGEAHLRRILRAYAIYYNDIRTHRSLAKDAPVSRSVQRTGIISSRPILGGLHHHCVRVLVFGTHKRLLRSTTVRRAPRRQRSVVLISRSSGIGCCGSTLAGPTGC